MFNCQAFRTFFQINAFPALYNFMVVNSKFLHRCIDTQMFFFHGFYNHSLEFRRISFVWYSFWHSKTPHLLYSISYCLTNGVQFSLTRHRAFCLISHFRLHHNSKKYLHQHWFPHLKGLHSNGQIFHSSTYSVHHNSIHLSQCQIHSHLLHWMLNRYTKMLLPKPLFQCRFHHYNSFLILNTSLRFFPALLFLQSLQPH